LSHTAFPFVSTAFPFVPTAFPFVHTAFPFVLTRLWLVSDVKMVLRTNSLSVRNSDDSSQLNLNMDRQKELTDSFELFWSTAAEKNHPIASRNLIVKSVCPKLYGMMTVKLGLLLTLIGGVGEEDRPKEDKRSGGSQPPLSENSQTTKNSQRSFASKNSASLSLTAASTPQVRKRKL